MQETAELRRARTRREKREIRPPRSRRATVNPDTRIGRYEFIRSLGRGGMGTVYLARDTKLGRLVAIKFLRSNDPRFTERLLIEARATARCNHEGIVMIHDVQENNDPPFIVLEYLKGQSFGDLMTNERLPPGRAVQLMVPVARALIYAHSRKIIHRDLKPSNIVLTDSGLIKVLDFGIAKFHYDQTVTESPRNRRSQHDGDNTQLPSRADLTSQGMVVGTMRYMSPEQWGAGTVDYRTDLLAAGIILYRMVVGRHPLAELEGKELMVVGDLNHTMPNARASGVDIPDELAAVIERCLQKRKDHRMPNADELVAALEPLLPGRRTIDVHTSDSPYIGLGAFQETDASHFFGRTREINAVVARLHQTPLLGIVGPSGAGKSSFIRAGVIPTLKHSGEEWETMIIRPGRNPMSALAHLLLPLLDTATSTLSGQVAQQQDTQQRLYDEPGYLGTVLRSHAKRAKRKLLLFVDQFEELYTLIRDPDERKAFTACLTGMADDALSPLRLILSIRSDFLDRAAEDRRFMSELNQNLVFVGSPDRDGLREAIVCPAEMKRYRFESSAMIEKMLDTLQVTPGCLPLLQFAATKLWEARDIKRHLLTEQGYRNIGGVAGALATHADAVLAEMTPRSQTLARAIFLQLVTAERTRAIISSDELRELGDNSDEISAIIQQLVSARLLVIQSDERTRHANVEIVHESLIHSWPTLSHWLEENHEDALFLEQLRTAARNWDRHGRAKDALWRGELTDEARSWQRRYRGPMPTLQSEFLKATYALATRSARRRRAGMIGVIVFLSMLVVAASVALVTIRDAEKLAQEQAAVALAAEQRAEKQAQEALVEKRNAEHTLDELQRTQSARDQAQTQAVELETTVSQQEKRLWRKNRELQTALKEAERARKDAEDARIKSDKARQAAEAATKQAETLLVEQRARVRKLEKMTGVSGASKTLR